MHNCNIKKIFRNIAFGIVIILCQFAGPKFGFEKSGSVWAEVLTMEEQDKIKPIISKSEEKYKKENPGIRSEVYLGIIEIISKDPEDL